MAIQQNRSIHGKTASQKRRKNG